MKTISDSVFYLLETRTDQFKNNDRRAALNTNVRRIFGYNIWPQTIYNVGTDKEVIS